VVVWSLATIRVGMELRCINQCTVMAAVCSGVARNYFRGEQN